MEGEKGRFTTSPIVIQIRHRIISLVIIVHCSDIPSRNGRDGLWCRESAKVCQQLWRPIRIES